MLSKILRRDFNLMAGLLLVVLILHGGFQALEAQESNIKLAVVDLDRIVALSAAGKELQTRLEKFQQDVQVEAEVMSNEAKEIRQRLVDGANSLSDEKLAELQKQLEDKTIAMRRLRDDKQREGQKIRAEGLREIERLLQPIFEKIRDEENYDLILNNVPGVVVMANERVDITQKVVDRLNATPSGG
ncbi:MAG: OmpH family outer membrane protein [bacterium]|nr:OmpH family outer membrane protein [bacterium]